MLVYVDDLLVSSHDEREGSEFLHKLRGDLEDQVHGQASSTQKRCYSVFREHHWERDSESCLSLGVNEAYMIGIIDSWHEKQKPNETPPKLDGTVAVGPFVQS